MHDEAKLERGLVLLFIRNEATTLRNRAAKMQPSDRENLRILIKKAELLGRMANQIEKGVHR